IDGEAVVTGAADWTTADEFAALLAKIRAVRQRDFEHVTGAGTLNERVPLVAAHAAPPPTSSRSMMTRSPCSRAIRCAFENAAPKLRYGQNMPRHPTNQSPRPSSRMMRTG